MQSKEVLQREEGAHEGAVLGVDTWRTSGLDVSGGLDKSVRVWEMVGEEEEEVEEEGAEENGVEGDAVD